MIEYTQSVIARINEALNELELNADDWRHVYHDLCIRYDDALRRIDNLQAENEALKMELARRN